jgi:hypothetical protein
MIKLIREDRIEVSQKLQIIKEEEHQGLKAFYHGQVNEQGLAHGIGRIEWHDSSIYEGQWKNGKYHGFGREIACN